MTKLMPSPECSSVHLTHRIQLYTYTGYESARVGLRQNKYAERDVVWFHEPYLDRMGKPVEWTQQGDAVYRVRGKLRPMLILEALSESWYYTLPFTTEKPGENDWADFLVKGNGAPRTFGQMLGFTRLSFLRIRPVMTSHENQAVGRYTQLPEFLFKSIMEEVEHQARHIRRQR